MTNTDPLENLQAQHEEEFRWEADEAARRRMPRDVERIADSVNMMVDSIEDLKWQVTSLNERLDLLSAQLVSRLDSQTGAKKSGSTTTNWMLFFILLAIIHYGGK